MSLRYLLDGYNIVHQIRGLYLKELEDQRLELIRFIEKYRPQGSPNNSVTIYFDGRVGYLNPSLSSRVKVIFSQDETADDLIKRAVEKSKNKKNIVVVTNDKDIQFTVRAQGAKILKVEDFLKKSVPKKRVSTSRRKGQPDIADAKPISKTIEFKINQELQDIWIKKKKS